MYIKSGIYPWERFREGLIATAVSRKKVFFSRRATVAVRRRMQHDRCGVVFVSVWIFHLLYWSFVSCMVVWTTTPILFIAAVGN